MNSSLFGSNNSEIESLDYDYPEDNDSSILIDAVAVENSKNADNNSQESIIVPEEIDNQNKANESINDNLDNDVFQSKMTEDNINEQSSNDNVVDVVSENNAGQLHIFKCKDCSGLIGKFLITEEEKCSLCGSSKLDVIDEDIELGQFMIPFNYSLDDAIKNYKKHVGLNPLVPRIFRSNKTIKSISKVYVSSELFDINASGDVSFFAGDKSISNDKEELKKFDVKNTVNFDFKDVLMCSSSKVSSPLFLGVSDFDFQQLKQVDNNMIGDACIVFSDLSPMDVSTYASNMVMDYSLNVIRKNVNHQLKKVNKNNIGVNFTNNKTVLVPLYLMNVTYNGHSYSYIMNGNTGKSTMKIPYGKLEIALMSIILFILIFVISLLFVYLV
jgi:hypothetical protein